MTEFEKNIIDKYALSESQAKALAPDIILEIKDAWNGGFDYATYRVGRLNGTPTEEQPNLYQYLKQKGYE